MNYSQEFKKVVLRRMSPPNQKGIDKIYGQERIKE